MKLEGDIGEIDLVERLVELGREQFTGALRFENDGIIKIIYFKTGDVLSASTNDRADSIDEILMRANKVTRDHVKQALAKRKESETLGDALLNLGFITRKELTWARRVQVIGVIRSITAWSAGTYTIVADYLPKREEGTLFPLPQIIVELVVTDQDRSKVERALDGGEAVLTRTADFDASFARLGLNEEAAAIVAYVDGARTASEIATASGKDGFNVYKLLHALKVLGLLTKRTEDLSFADGAVADAADVWDSPPPEPEPELEPEPGPTLEMPAWEAPSGESVARAAYDYEDAASKPTPAPPPIETHWGFDEAQIETARRAAVPLRSADGLDDDPKAPKTWTKKKPPRKSRGLWVALLVILLIAGAAYAGWIYWKGHETNEYARLTAPLPKKARVTRPPAPAPAPPPVATPLTITPTTTTIAPMTTTIAPAPVTPTTASAAPKPAPPPKPPVPPPTSTTAHIERTATGGAVITNTSAPGTSTHAPAPPTTATATSASDPQRARLDALAREHAQNATGNFTIQFELVCQAASLNKAMAQGGGNVWFVPTQYRGQSCYRVFWGHYATQDAARSAVGLIPEGLRGNAPVVVRVPKS